MKIEILSAGDGPFPLLPLARRSFRLLPLSWMNVEKYRVHDTDVESRNTVTPAEVLRASIFQQIFETALGAWWVSEEPITAPMPCAPWPVVFVWRRWDRTGKLLTGPLWSTLHIGESFRQSSSSWR